MNIASLLDRAGESFRSRPALIVGTEPHADYGAFRQRASRMAARMRDDLGLQPGDRVALAMKNCPQFLETLYAAWWAGLTCVPANPKLHRREFAFILDHSESKICFTDADLFPTIAPLVGQAGSLAAVIDAGAAAYASLDRGGPMPIEEVEPTDTAWLFYTSGTTGRPKGAMLTHRNLLSMTTSFFLDIEQVSPSDCILHAAPMSHGSGLYNFPHVARAAAHVIAPSGGFEPAEVFEMIAAHPGLAMFGAPTMVKRLVEYFEKQTAGGVNPDVSNLRSIIFGGAPMHVADVKRALAAFGPKLAQLYGQGESPMTITGMTRDLMRAAWEAGDDAKLGSAGISQTVCEVRVRDQDDRVLPQGEIGEICVRGDSVMKGYWRDDEATAKTLRNGWLLTGDMGSFDEDGYLTIHDRSKDLIISGGANIYPREVEEVLLTHDCVAECSVVGAPDPEWGEIVAAFVVARDGCALTEFELDALCRDNIARFKRPKSYRFVDSLPKNNYGKILKTELRTVLEAPPE